METNPKKAFHWIVDILKRHDIPFEIDGGLAARAYGAERELVDIDLVIPEDRFDEIIPEVEAYIQFGPSQFVDDKWNLLLMTLDYEGQSIDIAGSEHQKYFDETKHEWISSPADFSKSERKLIFGEEVGVIPKERLIEEKRHLGREVDLIDLEFLEKSNHFQAE